ncbi:PREDICTED: phosphopantothenoylcysteine decarboxylase-like isoform X1 [Priapulus caudatus]|uniref:Phosphopantothenoylcysteine decarboxylase-like isoform X1 n=1 Tax=Priapulus caudatus TaxID=37621 RepID=A0ABM1F197_PRICU|nr:PREDICTED: phosphopantothenoylcysteine decarboxylase-like isoform X1 [Priapulus caudatus]
MTCTLDRKHVLLGVTGSVAAVKVAELSKKLSSIHGVEVKIVATEKSLHFFDLEALRKSPVGVFTDQDEWKWSNREDPVLHIELRKWADVMVIAPLDANTLGKMVNGLCDNLLTCIIRAWDFNKPLIFCPAMNTFMWEHPITKFQIDKLTNWGFVEVPCIEKTLVCGDKGLGAMAEVNVIAEKIQKNMYL